MNWTLYKNLFLFWFSCKVIRIVSAETILWSQYIQVRKLFKGGNTVGVISGSHMCSQLLQNREIIKQSDILLWKIWRKYGSVSYLFSCKKISNRYLHSLIYNDSLKRGKKVNLRQKSNKFKEQKRCLINSKSANALFVFKAKQKKTPNLFPIRKYLQLGR